MIEIIVKGHKSKAVEMEKILNRNQLNMSKINHSVNEIITNVQREGDKALMEYTQLYDGVELDSLMVTPGEIEKAYNQCDESLILALEGAKENIWSYHQKQVQNTWLDVKEEGITLGQIVRPLEKVGIYVPGGTAPLPSSVLMNAIPAKVAGVKEIIMTTPPMGDGKVHDSILAAAKIAGVDKVFKMGGAQAIAAMAFGTESIPKVHKITGPGNIYVTVAKKMVYGFVDIDMIAGPSEILVIADENADAKYVAADLLSQGEHDLLASAILITPSMDLAIKVKTEIIRQAQGLPRKDIVTESFKNYGGIIVVESIDEAIVLSNKIAPEHLELMVNNPFEMLGKIENAGAIFLGNYSPEPLGDYYAGPNHTLPTGGTAKYYSPLGVDAYVKKSSVIHYSEGALLKVKDHIIRIAEEEGLAAHANAIKVRCEK